MLLGVSSLDYTSTFQPTRRISASYAGESLRVVPTRTAPLRHANDDLPHTAGAWTRRALRSVAGHDVMDMSDARNMLHLDMARCGVFDGDEGESEVPSPEGTIYKTEVWFVSLPCLALICHSSLAGLDPHSRRLKTPNRTMTDCWKRPPEPPTALGRHRPLAPLAGIHVSPLQLGAMSIGDKWEAFGMGSMNRETSFKLLDAFYEAGGNFIDTANN